MLALSLGACQGQTDTNRRTPVKPEKTEERERPRDNDRDDETETDGPQEDDDLREDSDDGRNSSNKPTPGEDDKAEELPPAGTPNKRPTTDGDSNNRTPSPKPQPPGPGADESKGITAIKLADVTKDLTYFASADFEGRGSGTPGLVKARDYLIERFKALGVKPGNRGEFLQEFSYRQQRTNISTANVVGFIEGTDPVLSKEVIVVGAHMDHLGTNGRDQIFYGADDNASGTVGLIYTAKAIKEAGGTKRSVVLIAFSGEEHGLIGSRYYVDNPIYPLDQTVLMINMDMIGYSDGNLQAMGVKAVQGLATRLESVVEQYPELAVEMTVDSGGRSDHAPFVQKNVPITLFHTGLHDHYHQVTDTAEKIDFEGYHTILRIVAEFTMLIGNDQSYTMGLSLVPRFLHRMPVDDIFDFKKYFREHGIGHAPQGETGLDHALYPGQPI